MRVQDIMSRNVVTVAPDATVRSARVALADNGVGHLVVVERKRVIGIVTERDLAGASEDAPLSDFATREVVTIGPAATVRRAAGILTGHAIGALPVVVDGALEGIVTTSDLLRSIAKGETHAAPSAERYVLRKRSTAKRPAIV